MFINQFYRRKEMKKILAIIIAAAMMFTVGAFFASANRAQPDVTSGWEMYPANDFTYYDIVDAASGELNFNNYLLSSDATNGGTYPAAGEACEGAIQTWVDQGHLWSTISPAITGAVKLVFKFNGTGLHLGASFRDTSATGIKMTVDGKEVENPYAANEYVAAMDGSHVVPAIIAGVENLEAGNHVVEIWGTTAVRVSYDWYEVVAGTTAYTETAQTADYIGIAAVVAAVALIGTAVIVSKKH